MKVLFFDLDDTLLNSEHEISERNRNAIIQCKNQGLLIGYITVRSPRKIKQFLNNLPCDCIANYNGAMIYADGNLNAQNNIPYSDAITFMSQMYKVVPDINMSCYCEPYCYRGNKLINTVTNEILDESIMALTQCDFQRFRIVLNGYEKVNIEQYISPSMRYQATINNTAIITSKEATKENAIKILMKHYNITSDCAISFGDDTNDIGMLQASGIGVAMGNALQEVKEAAAYISIYLHRDGFYYGYVFYSGGSLATIRSGVQGFSYEGRGMALISMNVKEVAKIEVDSGDGIETITVDPLEPFAVIIPANSNIVSLYTSEGEEVLIDSIMGY